jgi:hypothetical protein
MAGLIAGSIQTKGREYSDLRTSIAAAVAVLQATAIKSQFHCSIKKLVNFLDLF